MACASFVPEPIPDAPGTLPKAFSLYTGEADAALPWWNTFGSTELDQLVATALSDNFSLKETWARLQQARAVAVQAGADRYPDLTGTGFAETSRGRTSSTSRTSTWTESYFLGLSSGYEVDLWGRVRSQHESALLDVGASAADLRTASMTLAAEVADRWLSIISGTLQKNLLEQQLKNNQIMLDLIDLRFRNAMVSALDVYQQRQVMESVRAKMPLVTTQIRLQEHELAVLLGKPPGADFAIGAIALPEIGSVPALGLPTDLLANRPDVRAAGMRLKAAQWQLSEARANRLPKFRLGADARLGPGDRNAVFDNWLINLASNLTAPIFDGGRLAAEVDRTRARVDESLWTYRHVVLAAVKEVEDALENEAGQREHLYRLTAVMDAARRALEEATQRYQRGLSDYLPVLTQLLTVQDLELNLIQQQAALIRCRIYLYRALGCGWGVGSGETETGGVPEARE